MFFIAVITALQIAAIRLLITPWLGLMGTQTWMWHFLCKALKKVAAFLPWH
jgi:hypothetical protein